LNSSSLLQCEPGDCIIKEGSIDSRIYVLLSGELEVRVGEKKVAAITRIGEVFGHTFRWRQGLLGGIAIDQTGTAMPDDVVPMCQQCDAVLLGAVGGPKWDNPNAAVRPEQGLLGIRKALGLFANLRPVKTYQVLLSASPLKYDVIQGTDMIVVRELTGGLYFGKPSRRWNSPTGWRAVDTLSYTEQEIERVLRVSFELARGRRKKVTSVDKANVLTTGRFWREIATRVGADYPDVVLEHILVDAAAMYLIRRPATFDVMVTENMFGDILTDEASVLAGSMGMLPSASLGSGQNGAGGVHGLYEPIHGTALYTPEVVGTGRANPLAAILSGALMLRYSLNRPDDAAAIEVAVEHVLASGYGTPDIAGPSTQVVTTDRMGDLVIAALGETSARITAPAAG